MTNLIGTAFYDSDRNSIKVVHRPFGSNEIENLEAYVCRDDRGSESWSFASEIREAISNPVLTVHVYEPGEGDGEDEMEYAAESGYAIIYRDKIEQPLPSIFDCVLHLQGTDEELRFNLKVGKYVVASVRYYTCNLEAVTGYIMKSVKVGLYNAVRDQA